MQLYKLMQCKQAAGYAVLDLFTLNKPSALPLVISNDPPASADPSTVARNIIIVICTNMHGYGCSIDIVAIKVL